MTQDGKTAIYGAGNCGRDVLRVLRSAGCEVIAFVDNNAPRIGSVEGVPCVLPEEARTLAADGAAIVIAVYNCRADAGAIQLLLQEIGFRNILSYFALFEKFPAALRNTFWLAPRAFWEGHRAEILRGLELWADDTSRQIYLDLVQMRTTGDLQLLRNPDFERQYFPEDIPPLRNPVRFIDGGAFTGDTLAAMRRFDLEAVAAFEPDPGNFRSLRRSIGGLKNVTLFPCGLDAETAMRRFDSGREASSVLSTEGESTIQTVALDDVLPGFAPTFIKLDIEGAEIGALWGAEKMIRAHGPRLAVCAYHLPGHLWEVPLLMRQLLPDHRLFLRSHGYCGFDTVAYAVEP